MSIVQFCVACEDSAVLFLWRNRLYVRCVGSCGKVREVAV